MRGGIHGFVIWEFGIRGLVGARRRLRKKAVKIVYEPLKMWRPGWIKGKSRPATLSTQAAPTRKSSNSDVRSISKCAD